MLNLLTILYLSRRNWGLVLQGTPSSYQIFFIHITLTSKVLERKKNEQMIPPVRMQNRSQKSIFIFIQGWGLSLHQILLSTQHLTSRSQKKNWAEHHPYTSLLHFFQVQLVPSPHECSAYCSSKFQSYRSAFLLQEYFVPNTVHIIILRSTMPKN